MYTYNAKLTRVVDGDTIDAMIDLGFNTHVKRRIRLAGIDAWESRTRNLVEKQKGLKAKHRLEQILSSNDNRFILTSHGVGSFGRCLGTIYINDVNINDQLITEGHAQVYTKK